MVVGDLARRDAITGLGDDGSITRWVVALERLESIAEDLGVDTVIAGHGPPGGRDVLREARAYWSELAREVEEAIAEDISAEQIAERVPMERFRGLEHYDLHHRRNVEEAFAQLTSSSNVGAVGQTAPNVVAAP